TGGRHRRAWLPRGAAPPSPRRGGRQGRAAGGPLTTRPPTQPAPGATPPPRAPPAAGCFAPREPWRVGGRGGGAPSARAAAARCRSDAHIERGAALMRSPGVGGRGGAGGGEEVGAGVTRVAVGDHVVCSFIPACGTCRYCSTGRQNLCDAGKNAATGEFADG